MLPTCVSLNAVFKSVPWNNNLDWVKVGCVNGACPIEVHIGGLYPDGKTTYFAGYAITNMYDFFILFVIMAGAAALLLFLLARKLKTMMD